ncbi:unnamed protein product, partial [Brassica oleracea var. botrytis]
PRQILRHPSRKPPQQQPFLHLQPQPHNQIHLPITHTQKPQTLILSRVVKDRKGKQRDLRGKQRDEKI